MQHDQIIMIIGLIVANFGTFASIVAIYTAMVKKQSKIEFLLKQVCDKLNVSTETGI